MKRRSIRFRLTVWYALAVAAALVLFSLAIGFSMWRSLIHDVNEALGDRVRSVESFLAGELREPGIQVSEELTEYAHAFPANAPVRVDDEQATIFSSSRLFPWPAPSARPVRLRWQGHDYQLLARRIVQVRRS